MKIETSRVREFVDYVLGFYGPNELYDMKATQREVLEALATLLLMPNIEFAGDSVDRERVRDIILESRGK